MNTKPILLTAVIALLIVCSSASAQVCGNGFFLGQLSSNPFLSDSTANKFDSFGSPFAATSVLNPYTHAPVMNYKVAGPVLLPHLPICLG